MIHETFGDRLRKELDNRGLSQKEFSDKVHISESMIYKYLNNKALPRIDMLKYICMTLGVSSDYLLGLDKKPGKIWDKEWPNDNQRNNRMA